MKFSESYRNTCGQRPNAGRVRAHRWCWSTRSVYWAGTPPQSGGHRPLRSFKRSERENSVTRTRNIRLIVLRHWWNEFKTLIPTKLGHFLKCKYKTGCKDSQERRDIYLLKLINLIVFLWIYTHSEFYAVFTERSNFLGILFYSFSTIKRYQAHEDIFTEFVCRLELEMEFCRVS